MKSFKLYNVIFDKKIIKRQVQYIPREDLFIIDTLFENRIYKLRCLYHKKIGSEFRLTLLALSDLYEDLDRLDIDYGNGWYQKKAKGVVFLKYDKIKKVKLLQ